MGAKRKKRELKGCDMPETYTAWTWTYACPLPVSRAEVVEVWFRLGRSSERPRMAGVWSWLQTGGPGDVVGWRHYSAPAVDGSQAGLATGSLGEGPSPSTGGQTND